jgi:hypothetical protein
MKPGGSHSSQSAAPDTFVANATSSSLGLEKVDPVLKALRCTLDPHSRAFHLNPAKHGNLSLPSENLAPSRNHLS